MYADIYEKLLENIKPEDRCDILVEVQYLMLKKYTSTELTQRLDTFEINHSRTIRKALEKVLEFYLSSVLLHEQKYD